MAKHYGVRARGLEIVTSPRTLKQKVAHALASAGAALLYKLKVLAGWKVR